MVPGGTFHAYTVFRGWNRGKDMCRNMNYRCCILVCCAMALMVGVGPSFAQVKPVVTYYYTDNQGNVLATTDESGQILSRDDYHPYGASALSAPSSGPGFVGAISDPDSDLIYMQARYLDSSIGRFISKDPLASEFNQYSYASNNPVTLRDTTGLYTCNGTESQCERLEGGLEELYSLVSSMQTSNPARARLTGVLRAYGKKNDNNKVAVTFLASETPAVTRMADDGSAVVNFDLAKVDEIVGPDGPGYSNRTEFAASVAHEGQHLVDGKDTFNLSQRQGVLLDEANAFLTQAYVNQAAGSISRWSLWMPGYSRDDMRLSVYDNAVRAADAICKRRACK